MVKVGGDDVKSSVSDVNLKDDVAQGTKKTTPKEVIKSDTSITGNKIKAKKVENTKKKSVAAAVGKVKVVDNFLSNMQKRYGAETIRPASELEDTDWLETGIRSFDMALGGGLGLGRLTQFYGENACGKTSTALKIARKVSEEGGSVLYVDAECALNPDRLESFGLDMDNIILLTPETGNEGFDLIIKALESRRFDLIVVDSIDAMIPNAEMQSSSGDANMGVKARMMNQFLRKVPNLLRLSRTSMIFINQLRVDLKTGRETTPGGQGIGFYISHNVKFFKSESVANKFYDNGAGVFLGRKHSEDTLVGVSISCTVVKNRFYKPEQKAVFGLLFTGEVYEYNSVIDKMTEYGILTLDKATYYIGDEKIGIKSKVILKFSTDKDLYNSKCDELMDVFHASKSYPTERTKITYFDRLEYSNKYNK